MVKSTSFLLYGTKQRTESTVKLGFIGGKLTSNFFHSTTWFGSYNSKFLAICKCQHVYNDNGTNFLGVNGELKNSVQTMHNQTTDYCSGEDVS